MPNINQLLWINAGKVNEEKMGGAESNATGGGTFKMPISMDGKLIKLCQILSHFCIRFHSHISEQRTSGEAEERNLAVQGIAAN